MKIETKKDVAQKRKRGRDIADVQFAFTQDNYLSRQIDEVRKSHRPLLADRDVEDGQIKDVMMKSGFLKFDKEGRAIGDGRITPQEEKKLIAFADAVTKGDRSLVVEMADRHFSVFPKESMSDGKKDYVIETADYSSIVRKKQKAEIEG
jgi:hypothetical protein